MYIKCILPALLILLLYSFVLQPVMSTNLPISTTVDGNFQAIAQTCNLINIYIRSEGKPVELYVNDILYGEYNLPENGKFTCISIDNLAPNTTYRFRLGKSGPEVWEKTWAKLHDADFDILVIGGNAGGCAAAVTASRMGLRVGIVEETNRLGGMSSNGLGSVDIRRETSCNGFFEEFRKSIASFKGGNGLRFESRISNAIAKSMVYTNTGIVAYLKCSALSPLMKNNKVTGAVVKNLVDGSVCTLKARVIVDDTDSGDFSAACGVKYMAGRESRTEAEPHAGHIFFDDQNQAILPGSTGKGDKKLQSYAYLMQWKDYGNELAPEITKPQNYSPDIYKYSPEWLKTWAFMYGRVGPNKYEINQHPFGTDWPGINFRYIKANPQEREQINKLYKDRALGYLYYMQNEAGLRNLGLADDEFLDNDNFPVSIYLRETRRIVGEYVYREDDVRGMRRVSCPDSIAIGDYPMDSHAMEDIKDPSRKDKGEGEMFLSSFTPIFMVPYGVIVPKKINNLLVTSCASSTHVARGALRMEPVRMSLGQAAGIAASLSIRENTALRNLDINVIQQHILQFGGHLAPFRDVFPATPGFMAIQQLGTLRVFRDDFFRPDDTIKFSEAVDAIQKIVTLLGLPLSEPGVESNQPVDMKTLADQIKEQLGVDMQVYLPYAQSVMVSRGEAAELLYNAYRIKAGLAGQL